MKTLQQYIIESKDPKREIYEFVEIWIDEQYQEGLLAYDDEHIIAYAKGEEEPNYDEIVKAIIEEFMTEMSSNTKNILKKFLDENQHQDRDHSEVINQILLAIENFASTLGAPGY